MGDGPGRSATEVVAALHRGFSERDEEALLGCLAEDVRWHVPGESPLAGTYEGRDRAWAELFQPLWASPARIEDDQIVANGDHVVALGREVHDFGDGQRTFDTVEVLRVRDGQVTERWAFTTGQDELDVFLTRGCAMADEAVTADA